MNNPLLSLVAGLALSAGTCPAEIVFHETFAKGRETQNPPESLAWFATVAESAKVEDGAVVLTGANESPRALIATFPTVTLEPGDRLLLTFDLELAGEIGICNGAMRVGIYNAERTPLADGEDPGTVATGYLVAMTNSRHTASQGPYTGTMFFERLADAQQKADPNLTSHQNHIKFVTSGVRPGFYESGVPYNVGFAIEPVSSSATRLGFKIMGGTFTDQNDFEAEAEGSQGQSFREFNTILLLINASSGDGDGGFPEAAISNIKLEVIRK